MTASAAASASTLIPADLRKLQCYVVHTQHFRGGRIDVAPCNGIVVFRVFTPSGALDMCNSHFNEYFETHEIEPEMVMRLSDDEDDFIIGPSKCGKRKRNGNASSSGGSSNGEPICQVPKPRPVR